MGAPKIELSAAEAKRLRRVDDALTKAEDRVQRAREEWVQLVQTLPQSAVARELEVSRQAISERLKRARQRER